MEQNPMEPTNDMPESQAPQSSPKKDGGLGATIGIIIIIILLALGAMYYFTAGVDQIQNGQVTEGLSADEEAALLKDQGSSTNLADIEADLEATDLSGLDDASAGFDAELQTQ